MDGASNAKESGASLILANSDKVVAECTLRFLFKAINNQTKYEVLLAGLKVPQKLGMSSLRVFTDS